MMRGRKNLSAPQSISFVSVFAAGCKTTLEPRSFSGPAFLRWPRFFLRKAGAGWRSTPPESASPAPRWKCAFFSSRSRWKGPACYFSPGEQLPLPPARPGEPAWAQSCCYETRWGTRTCKWCSGSVTPLQGSWGWPALTRRPPGSPRVWSSSA